jgi:nitrite reductase/ring-hydroxylating ferredoxin subunit
MASENPFAGETLPARRAPAAYVAAGCPTTASRGSRRKQQPGRRQFIGWVAIAPFAFAFAAMLRRLQARNQPAPVAVAADVPVGLSIGSDIIVNRSADGSIHAFAARCTHLGCRLDRVIDGVIVCPCHGSRFQADGRVAAGPALRPLAELRVSPDERTGGWTVHAG